MIKNLNTNNELKEKIKKKHLYLKAIGLPRLLDKLIDKQTENSRFLIDARK